jgi:hypothetical protein
VSTNLGRTTKGEKKCKSSHFTSSGLTSNRLELIGGFN